MGKNDQEGCESSVYLTKVGKNKGVVDFVEIVPVHSIHMQKNDANFFLTSLCIIYTKIWCNYIHWMLRYEAANHHGQN